MEKEGREKKKKYYNIDKLEFEGEYFKWRKKRF